MIIFKLETKSFSLEQFQSFHNNSQQHATGCPNGRNMKHPTMLRPFARGFRAANQLAFRVKRAAIWTQNFRSTNFVKFNKKQTLAEVR